MTRKSSPSLRGCSVLLLLLGLMQDLSATPPSMSATTLTGGNVQLSITSEIGTTNLIETATNLFQPAWQELTNFTVSQSPYLFIQHIDVSEGQRFFRVSAISPVGGGTTPSGMALIDSGEFEMGDTFSEGAVYEGPVHTVSVSAFYMDKYEVSKGLWDRVKTWNNGNGYGYDDDGSGKGSNHPVQTVNWFDAVKWCNARSEMERRVPAYYTDPGLTMVYKSGQVAPYVNWHAGYRLPTEAEWEKAARGGASGHRFPWSTVDTISHSQANYFSDSSYSYDVSPTRGYNPAFNDGVMPYTSPVGSFAPNGYGLYDMAGNVWEWCWDWAGNYPSAPQTDPHGPDSGSTRVGRGGNWNFYAEHCRDSYRYGNPPTDTASNIGFRCALPAP